MINYDKLIRQARQRAFDDDKYTLLIKYLKYRQDKTIYNRIEEIVYWNSNRVIKEESARIETRRAESFKDYLENNGTKIIKENVIYK